MVRNRVFAHALICLLGLTVAASAFAADLNVAVVNIARLLDEAPQAKKAMSALQEEFAPRQRDIVSLEQSLRESEEALRRDMEIMAEAERVDAERGLRDQRRDLLRRQNEYLEDLNIRRNEELGRLQRALMQEVEAFARQNNYDLVLGDGVLYASGSVDVTAQVLGRLERSFQGEGGN